MDRRSEGAPHGELHAEQPRVLHGRGIPPRMGGGTARQNHLQRSWLNNDDGKRMSPSIAPCYTRWRRRWTSAGDGGAGLSRGAQSRVLQRYRDGGARSGASVSLLAPKGRAVAIKAYSADPAKPNARSSRRFKTRSSGYCPCSSPGRASNETWTHSQRAWPRLPDTVRSCLYACNTAVSEVTIVIICVK